MNWIFKITASYNKAFEFSLDVGQEKNAKFSLIAIFKSGESWQDEALDFFLQLMVQTALNLWLSTPLLPTGCQIRS